MTLIFFSIYIRIYFFTFKSESCQQVGMHVKNMGSQYGMNYEDTFTPVTKMTIVCTLIAVAFIC